MLHFTTITAQHLQITAISVWPEFSISKYNNDSRDDIKMNQNKILHKIYSEILIMSVQSARLQIISGRKCVYKQSLMKFFFNVIHIEIY